MSLALHVVVLVALVCVADLAPTPSRFDVFAADPVDPLSEPLVPETSPVPPRPTSSIRPPNGRLSQFARSLPSSAGKGASAPSAGVVRIKNAPPKDPPVAMAATPQPAAGVATPSPPLDQPLAAPPAPDVVASLELPADQSQATVALLTTNAQADLPTPPTTAARPVIPPPAPEAVSPSGPASAAPLQPVPVLPLAQVPAPSTADAPAPIPPPQVLSVPVPRPNSSLVPEGGADSPAQATADRAPEPVIPRLLPIRHETAEPVTSPAPPAPVEVEPRRQPPVVRGVSATPRRPDASTASHGSSPLGLGLGRLRIRLDGASVRTTERETDVISGTLVGGQPERVVVQIDERTSTPILAGRAFATAVKVSPGVNRVRVLATDAQGTEVEEIVTIEYKPPATAEVAITSPRDGYRLAADDAPLLTVQGEVSDPGVRTVWLVANDRRVVVPVTGGRFRHVLPVLEPEVRIRAEMDGDARSATVTVDSSAAFPAIGLLLGDGARDPAGAAKLAVTWRANPATLDGGAQQLSLRGAAADGEAGGDFFYLRKARPGVYTFLLTYRGVASPAFRPVLYLAGTPRSLQPVTLDGSGRAVVARVLLPQGVLWEQEDWFTGQSASGDTVTKFRFPDGVSWTERVGDVGR